MNRTCLLHCLSEYGHDAAGGSATQIEGVELYAARGLVIPAAVAVVPEHPLLDETHQYFRDLGFGPERVVTVPVAGSLYKGVRSSPRAQQIVRDHVASGGEVEFYIPGRNAWSLAEDLGIPARRVRNQPLNLAPLTDKVGLRRLADELGRVQLFPCHKFGKTKREVVAAARWFFEHSFERVVIKRPDLASGEGQLLLSRPEDLANEVAEAFFDRYVTGRVEFVIEEWWEGEDFSAVFEVTEDSVELMHMSGQFMSKADGVTHMGNYLGNRPTDILPGTLLVGGSWQERMQERCLPVLNALRWRGYRGKICFDGKVRPATGAFKLFEANPRPSASIFPRYVLEQARRDSKEKLGVSMLSVTPDGPVALRDGVKALGSLAYDSARRRGVIIGNPIRMADAHHPETGVFAVADSVDASIRMALRAKQLFEGVRFSPVTLPAHLAHLVAA